jgi:hypothetical protein
MVELAKQTAAPMLGENSGIGGTCPIEMDLPIGNAEGA